MQEQIMREYELLGVKGGGKHELQTPGQVLAYLAEEFVKRNGTLSPKVFESELEIFCDKLDKCIEFPKGQTPKSLYNAVKNAGVETIPFTHDDFNVDGNMLQDVIEQGLKINEPNEINRKYLAYMTTSAMKAGKEGLNARSVLSQVGEMTSFPVTPWSKQEAYVEAVNILKNNLAYDMLNKKFDGGSLKTHYKNVHQKIIDSMQCQAKREFNLSEEWKRINRVTNPERAIKSEINM